MNCRQLKRRAQEKHGYLTTLSYRESTVRNDRFRVRKGSIRIRLGLHRSAPWQPDPKPFVWRRPWHK